MTFPIRFAVEPSTTSGAVWVRLRPDDKHGRGEFLDAVARNFSAPVAVTDPPELCDVAKIGMPARAWCNKLRVTEGDSGALELQGLVSCIDQVLVKPLVDGTIWARVGIIDDFVHPVTGQHLGPKLTSIELSSPPFECGDDLYLERKDLENMANVANTLSPETTLILAKLNGYTAENETRAIEKCALTELPETRKLSREFLFEHIIKPVKLELATRRLRENASAGRPMRASVSEGAATRPADASKPVLDVSRFACEPNRFSKVIAHVKATNPGLDHERACALASDLSRSHTVIG